MTKKPAPKATTPRAAKPSSAPDSFTSLVRASVAKAVPHYLFVSSAGGSGPIVTFERPNTAGLRETVAFQKGLHGATWFRVNFFPYFVGEVSDPPPLEHLLWDGAQAGTDVAWKSDADLAPLLERACGSLEAAADKFFKPFERAAPRYAKLLAPLGGYYKEWLASTGGELPEDAFEDGDDGKLPAFESFCAFLKTKRLFMDLPSDVETPLWRYWHNGRPMRKEDYQRDDYYDCTVCKEFIAFSKGKLLAKKDADFGTRYEFVCKKH